MASGSNPSADSAMSQSGPRNFYCHQCNSRTRVSAEEFTCASCGSGFIEEIVENDADEGREGGAGSNSEDPWAHDSEFEADAHEMFGPHSMIEHIFAQALGPGFHSGGGSGGGGGPTIIRTRRGGPGPNVTVGNSRGPGGPSILIGSGPGDQFLQSLLSNLTGVHGPGQFQFMMGGPAGSNVMYGNPGDYAWGRGGFDAIVTQLLNQMEGTGPPRMEKDDIAHVPIVTVTKDHLDQKAQCSVCWEDFVLDEEVRQLKCEHIFHKDCIVPWLELHATCPVCRKPQNDAAAVHSRQAQNEAAEESGSNVGVSSSNFFGSRSNTEDNASEAPMMEEDASSQDPTPSASTTSSSRRANSTTNSSSSEVNGPSTVPAETEAAYSLGNPISTILNQLFGQPSPSSSSSRSSRNQFSFGFPSSSSSSATNPNQSNAFSQATSTSSSTNGETTSPVRHPFAQPVDVSSSSSTETGENCNGSTTNGSRSSLPSADSSTGNSTTRLNTAADSNTAASATSTSNIAPTDFQDLDLE